MEVRGPGEAETEDEETVEACEVPEDGDDFYVDYYFKSNNKNDLSISPFIPDISNEDDKLDALEGIVMILLTILNILKVTWLTLPSLPARWSMG